MSLLDNFDFEEYSLNENPNTPAMLGRMAALHNYSLNFYLTFQLSN